MTISNTVENPIISRPFEEPTQHYDFSGDAPMLRQGRRPASYYRGNRTQMRSLAEQEHVPLDLVNTIRQRLTEWRTAGYPGTTRITRDLLRHWSDEREQPLFYCQREAVETIIWLTEAPHSAKTGIDVPNDGGHFVRYCLKLATGSGKTVVMAMIIAWSVLNKVARRQDKRFSDVILVVAPNLTVKERLQVLLPTNDDNYYQRFDLVPISMRPHLGQGRYLITNWHIFQPQDDTHTRSVVKLGPESDTAFCTRTLRDLGKKSNILVFNDEGHHAYRISTDDYAAMQDMFESTRTRKKKATSDPEEEREATIWVGGLDRIHAVRKINMCIDMSATPYYISGSGREEGTPFEWIVSDFGLVDAIECGIVKVPRIPVDDNAGDILPRYFNLWDSIKTKLPKTARKGDPTGETLIQTLVGVEGALVTLASEWRKTRDIWQQAGRTTPPVLIVVCNETKTAEVLHAHIASGQLFPELRNEAGKPDVTIRIDTRLLNDAESRTEGESRADSAERLRKILATVGKPGQPGEHVRCVVSVGMLTEGWDAQTVTHILGLRAFTSQLLVEQVVGRGLRRSSYDDLTTPEFVDIYGIPFQAIPVQETRSAVHKPPPDISTVRALSERAHMEIRFPRVIGYLSDIRQQVTADIANMPILKVSPTGEPTFVTMEAPTKQMGPVAAVAPSTLHERRAYYITKRLQTTLFDITNTILHDMREQAVRHQIFYQVARLVQEYVATRIDLSDESCMEEIALERYKKAIAERLRDELRDITVTDKPALLPVLDSYRPEGTTRDVIFNTTRPIWKTTRSHVSHVVLESRWEKRAAQILESHDHVVWYVRNYKLDFTIPYHFAEKMHQYIPDFIVVLAKDLQDPNSPRLHLILEIKGMEDEQDRQKVAGARRWCEAVSSLEHRVAPQQIRGHGHVAQSYGYWRYAVCKDVDHLRSTINGIIAGFS